MLDPVVRDRAERDFAAKEPDKSPSESIYYPRLDRPALIIYPLDPKEPSAEKPAIATGQDRYLVALKVAIPGNTTNIWNEEGDITYIINTVAQEYWRTEFDSADHDDVDDVDD
jgi:hypothetical protein